MRFTYSKIAAMIIIVFGICIYLIQQKPPLNSIQVVHQPSQETLIQKGVFQWPTWEKEPSEFIWQFSETEIAYILEGEVYVTPEGSKQSVYIKQGDLATFAPGLRCHWRVTKPFKKHVILEEDFWGKWIWKVTFKLQAIPRFFREQFA